MAAAVHLTALSLPRAAATSSSSTTSRPLTSSSFLPSAPVRFSYHALRRSVPRKHLTRPTAGTRPVVSALGKLSEADLVPVPTEQGGWDEAKIPTGGGVYGVFDGNGELQFIGLSRNIAASIATHRKTVPELCCSVKVGLIDEPAPDRAVLTDAWKSWMQEYVESTGRIPPGNETGNNTWLRRPQKKPDLRLTPGRHVQLTVPLEELIDRLVKENRVVAFIKGPRSAPQCGFSQRVVGMLESNGVDFECVNVLDEEYNNGLRETLKRYSNWPTFPQIFVKGELIGGCDILSSMEEKGELATLFEK